MKITGILGSPRGKNSLTRKLLESALGGAEAAGAETEIIDVTRLKLQYCIGCCACYRTGKCVLKDDFAGAYEKMINSDGIVLASPVYFNSVSAQLKTFIDRTADCRHCLLLSDKYAMSVTTTASSGAPQTLDFMNNYLIDAGAYAVGGVSYVVAKGEKLEDRMKEAADMGVDLVTAICSQRKYPEQERAHTEFVKGFRYAVMRNKGVWTSEYEHFKARGWI
jgi:multimeric flavodoxin WrbA